MEFRDLVNKTTKEVVLRNVEWEYDEVLGVYHIHDVIHNEINNTIINIYLDLDEDYKSVGLIFNDHFYSYAMLPEEAKLPSEYEDYKVTLKKQVIEDLNRKYSLFVETNDKFIKVRKKGKSHGKENGAN